VSGEGDRPNSGSLTVAGTTTSQDANATVNGLTASLYADWTFAKDGFTMTNGNNSFTAIARDSYGRADTNTVTVNLPATNTFTYDLNGNFLSELEGRLDALAKLEREERRGNQNSEVFSEYEKLGPSLTCLKSGRSRRRPSPICSLWISPSRRYEARDECRRLRSEL